MNYYATTFILKKDGSATSAYQQFESKEEARGYMYQFFADNVEDEEVDTLFGKVVTLSGDVLWEETRKLIPENNE